MIYGLFPGITFVLKFSDEKNINEGSHIKTLFSKKGIFVISPGYKNDLVYPLRVTTIPIGPSACCQGRGQIKSPLGWEIREGLMSHTLSIKQPAADPNDQHFVANDP